MQFNWSIIIFATFACMLVGTINASEEIIIKRQDTSHHFNWNMSSVKLLKDDDMPPIKPAEPTTDS